MAEIYVTDVGTILEFTIIDQDNAPVNLTGATVKMHVKLLGTNVATKTCQIVDAINGKVSYTVTTVNELWNSSGNYTILLEVSWVNGNKFSSSKITQSIIE